MKQLIFILFLTVTVRFASAQSWYPLGSGLIGSGQYDRVNTLCSDSAHNRLIAAGLFQMAGFDSVNNVAWWDGVNWHPLQVYVSNNDTINYALHEEITSSIMFQNKFLCSINQSQFDGRYWLLEINEDSISSRIIGTFNAKVNAMCIYHDTLYVAGYFTQYQSEDYSTTINLNGIAKWNGTDFVPVGGGLGGGIIESLCIHNNKLIAGGFFEDMDGIYCKNIAQWDGIQWDSIGAGIGVAGNYSDYVYSVCSYNGKLYAGGIDFTIGNGNDLVYWNGVVWVSAPSMFASVTELDSINRLLLIGAHTCIDFVSTNAPWWYVAQFNDTTWKATGQGPLGIIMSFATWNNSIYAAGVFNYIRSGTYTGFVARYDPTPLPTVTASNRNINCNGNCNGTANANA